MHKHLLLDVVKAIKERGHIKFSMDSWVSMNCSTSGCAIGCYCLANPHVKLKLEFLGRSPDGVEHLQPVLYQSGDQETFSYTNFVACAKYFDITNAEAHYLFNPNEYFNPTAHTVIERIRHFVSRNH